jgi:hypothetical protein
MHEVEINLIVSLEANTDVNLFNDLQVPSFVIGARRICDFETQPRLSA